MQIQYKTIPSGTGGRALSNTEEPNQGAGATCGQALLWWRGQENGTGVALWSSVYTEGIFILITCNDL